MYRFIAREHLKVEHIHRTLGISSYPTHRGRENQLEYIMDASLVGKL